MVKRRKSLGADKESKLTQENSDPTCVSGAVAEEKEDTATDAVESEDTQIINDLLVQTNTKVDGDGEPKTKIKSPAAALESAQSVRPTHQIATRSVTGRLKGKHKRDASPPTSPVPQAKRQAIQKDPKASTNTPEQKTRRQWELWGAADKDIFFKGLSEFGKDFDSIQHLVSQNIKKRSTESEPIAVKSKDQIRHFYYRTWHKISKYLEFDHEDDVSKQALELYGLINYGELRKKIGSKLDEKSGQKLRELVHKGTTTVKVKGTNRRVKTLVCKALKKLNHIDDNKDDDRYKMPEKVSLELIPSCNKAWGQVQALSQNPRLRMRVATSTKISSLIKYLDNKWKPDRVRMKEALGDTEQPSSHLVMHALAETILKPFVPKPTVPNHRLDLAFEAYKENIKNLTQAGVIGSNSSPQNKKGSKSNAKQLADDGSHSKKSKAGDQDIVRTNCITPSSSCSSLCSLTTCSSVGPAELSTDNAIMETDTFFKLSSASAKASTSEEQSKEEREENGDDADKAEETKEEAKVRLLREGLTCDSDNITVGDIYLIMAKPETFVLRYEWKEKFSAPQIIEFNESVTNMLRRLVHLAKLEFTDRSKSKPTPLQDISSPPKQCTCGFYTDGTPPDKKSRSSPATRGGRNPSTPKNARRNQAGNKTPDTPKSGRKDGARPKEILPAENPGGVPAVHGPGGDSVFRVPTAAPPKASTSTRQLSPNTQADQNLLQQIKFHKQPEFLIPRGGRRQLRRNIRKPLVVQRTLLPKAEVPSRQIMTLTVLPNTAQGVGTGSFMPVASNPALAGIMGQPIPAPVTAVPQSITPSIITMTPESASRGAKIRRIVPTPVSSTGFDNPIMTHKLLGTDILKQAAAQARIINEAGKEDNNSAMSRTLSAPSSLSLFSQPQAITGMDAFLNSMHVTTAAASKPGSASISSEASARSSPPPSISALLDISLPAAPEISDSTDKLIDMAICNNSNSSFTGLLEATVGKGGEKDALPSSPTKFKGIPSLSSEMQWLNGEDFNLSSFLSDSPQKSRPAASSSAANSSANISIPSLMALNEASRDSILGKLDVDAAMQSIMNENSLDYVTKFADLAAEVAATAHEQKKAADASV